MINEYIGTNTIAQIQLIFIILGTPSKSYLSSLNSDCFRRLILSKILKNYEREVWVSVRCWKSSTG